MGNGKKVEQIFLDAHGAEDTIIISKYIFFPFSGSASGTEHVLEKQPKERISACFDKLSAKTMNSIYVICR